MGSNAQRKATSSGRACDAGSMKRQKTWDDAAGEQQHASKKRFVGVRQRPSGRWVAEIKDTTQKIRLWLGTFDSAEEGAKAYDSAARALRGANTRTNFVTALSCESPAASSKAARLIRLRQIAAANAKLEAEKSDHVGAVSSSSDPLLRHDVNPQPTCSDSDRRAEDDRHSQVTTPPFLISSSPPKPPHKNSRRDNASPNSGPPPASADSDNGPSFEPTSSSLKLEPQITAENLSNAVNLIAAASPQLLPDPPLSRLPSKNCCNSPEALQPNLGATPNEKRDPPPPETSAVSAFSCATSESSCASSWSSSDQLQHDAIPWSDYVLADALDLPSCETNCGFPVYASAFDFWAEAMDRDSCASSHVLLEDHSDVDSTEFLLTATIPHDHQSASGSSEMDRVGGDAGEICSSHDGDDQLEPGGPLWITQCAYKGPCSRAR